MIISWLTASGLTKEVSATNPLPVSATVSATAQTVAKATAAAPSYSEGDTAAPLSVDLAGGLRITGTINASSSMRSTTAAPSYVNATDNSFSSNLTGDLRVIAKQSGTWSVSLDASQTIAVTNLPTAVDVNSGNKSNSTLRVVLATDQVQLTNALKVDGSAVTQPVSGTVTANLGTIAGVATAAKQPAPGTAGTASADVISVQGIASMTALKVDGSGVTQPVSGTFWQATQPVSIATAPVLVAGSAIIGKVGIDQTTPGTTDSVSVATAQGAGATIGVTSGAAVITDANGTLQQYLRGLIKQWIAGTLVIGTGTNTIGNVGHGKTIKTATLSAVTADTDLVAAVSSKRIKVIAYALFTTGTTASTLAFKSNGVAGTLLANVMLQSQASAIFGANLAIPAPSFLFATVAGEKLTLDVGNTDPITGFITYFDDDAT